MDYKVDIILNVDNVGTVYGLIADSQQNAINTLLEFIDDNATTFATSEKYYKQLSPSLLELIVKRDTFEVPEMTIFEMLLNVKKAHDDDSMDDVFKHIRLNLISAQDFAKTIRETKIFTDSDYFGAVCEEKRPRSRRVVVEEIPVDPKEPGTQAPNSSGTVNPLPDSNGMVFPVADSTLPNSVYATPFVPSDGQTYRSNPRTQARRKTVAGYVNSTKTNFPQQPQTLQPSAYGPRYYPALVRASTQTEKRPAQPEKDVAYDPKSNSMYTYSNYYSSSVYPSQYDY